MTPCQFIRILMDKNDSIILSFHHHYSAKGPNSFIFQGTALLEISFLNEKVFQHEIFLWRLSFLCKLIALHTAIVVFLLFLMCATAWCVVYINMFSRFCGSDYCWNIYRDDRSASRMALISALFWYTSKLTETCSFSHNFNSFRVCCVFSVGKTIFCILPKWYTLQSMASANYSNYSTAWTMKFSSQIYLHFLIIFIIIIIDILFQGFSVSLFYCFLNSEVRNTLRHRFNTWRDERNIRRGQSRQSRR